jgi:dihydrofolate synthase/folylpolyglutamate synthase
LSGETAVFDSFFHHVLPTPMNYPQAVAWLDHQQMFKIKLGLASTRELLAELGNPQNQLEIIHLAGTNGKGSVGATLLALLSAGGYRTGFYSSPHLSSVRERFRIGEHCIPETDFARLITRLAELLADRPSPTYFELTTLLALLWFAEQQAEVVILETGMGGRLDATNVVLPLVAIITDISRDHEQHLGSTLTAIAGEKAGIIKPNVPTVFSGRAAEALPVIEARCRELHSPLLLYGRDFDTTINEAGTLEYRSHTGSSRPGLVLALQGAHQAVNTSLALAALDLLAARFPITEPALRQGLQQVRWPGRMERITLLYRNQYLSVLLDGAHNEAGVEALVDALRHGSTRRRLLLVWGNMADKEMGPVLVELMAMAERIILTRAESHRSADPAMLMAQLPPDLQTRCQCVEPVEQALATAAALAGPEDLLCVAGSLYLVGRVRQLLVGEVAT